MDKTIFRKKTELTFKISFRQDSLHTGKDVTGWEWLSDQEENPIVRIFIKNI